MSPPYNYKYLADPAQDAKTVTPGTNPLPAGTCRALYIGTGGTVEVVTAKGTTVSFSNVPDGTILPVQCHKVLSPGSGGASDIVALY